MQHHTHFNGINRHASDHLASKQSFNLNPTRLPGERRTKLAQIPERRALGDLTSTVFNEFNRTDIRYATRSTYRQPVMNQAKQADGPAFCIFEDVSNDENKPPQQSSRLQRTVTRPTRQAGKSAAAGSQVSSKATKHPLSSKLTFSRLRHSEFYGQNVRQTSSSHAMDLTVSKKAVTAVQSEESSCHRLTADNSSILHRIMGSSMSTTEASSSRRRNAYESDTIGLMLKSFHPDSTNLSSGCLLDLSSDSTHSRDLSNPHDSSFSSAASAFHIPHSMSPTNDETRPPWFRVDDDQDTLAGRPLSRVFEVYRDSNRPSESDNVFSSPSSISAEFSIRGATFSPTISRPTFHFSQASDSSSHYGTNFSESGKRLNPHADISFDSTSCDDSDAAFSHSSSTSKYRAIESDQRTLRTDKMSTGVVRHQKQELYSTSQNNMWNSGASVADLTLTGPGSHRDLLPASTDLSLENLSCSGFSSHPFKSSVDTFMTDDDCIAKENIRPRLDVQTRAENLPVDKLRPRRPALCDVTNLAENKLPDNCRVGDETKSAICKPDSKQINRAPVPDDDCDEYMKDILSHLRSTESRMQPNPSYMDKQTDITHGMRSILVDWLVGVADEFKLSDETIQLAVNYVDRFLSVMNVQRSKLQLVGTACMFIAAKYEEIYPPDVDEFVYITDDTYKKQQVFLMELLIIKALNFSLAFATPLTFLNMFVKMTQTDQTTAYLAQYLCELTLLEGQTYLCHSASHVAAACLTLARHNMVPIRRRPSVHSSDSANQVTAVPATPQSTSSSSSLSSASSSSDLESDHSSDEDSDGSRMNRGAAWPAKVICSASNWDLRLCHFKSTLLAVHNTHKRVGEMAQQVIADKYKTDRYHRVGMIVPRPLV